VTILLLSVGNHLWQSTVFAVAVAAMAWSLKEERAAIRHALWCAASLKFLVPFAPLVALGRTLGVRPHAPNARPAAVALVTAVAQPFAQSRSASLAGSAHVVPAAAIATEAALAVWVLGGSVVLCAWVRGWIRARRLAARATPDAAGALVRVVRQVETAGGMRHATRVLSSDRIAEPAVWGFLRPVILWPAGAHLTARQTRALVEHELAHVRRRDNLTGALQAVVEIIWWFHPFVWWIESRLLEERERACDEEVLDAGHDAVTYARGILAVCERACTRSLAVSGIGGSILGHRIESIMSNERPRALSGAKKLVLAVMVTITATTPILAGAVGSGGVVMQAGSQAFDAASVKANHAPDESGMMMRFLPGGRFVARNEPLWSVIAAAYGVPRQSVRLSGGPDWIRADKFDIEAEAPAGAVPQDLAPEARAARVRHMLQRLLADRFHLVIRRNAAPVAAYVVRVGKGGSKLQPTSVAAKDCAVDSGPGVPCHVLAGGMGRGLHGKSVSAADIVSFVENWTDLPIVDMTGLTGLYDIDTDGWMSLIPLPTPGVDPTPEAVLMADPTRPSLGAVFERLGLRMAVEHVPVETLFIESVEHPIEN
jgi:uncharacterized protein (TIGR03435 family)